MGKFNSVCVILWSVTIGICVTADVPGGYYTSRYDALDLDDILNHKRLVYHYAECLLNKGPCPPQAIDLKRVLPEALETNCGRCTEKQKLIAKNAIKRIQSEYPNIWKDLKDFYDPSGDKFRKFVEMDVSTDINNDDFENNIAGTLKPIQLSINQNMMTTSKIPLTSSTMIRRIAQQTTTVNPIAVQDPFQLLGSFAEFGQQVIKAGTQVADMFLSTVRAFMAT